MENDKLEKTGEIILLDNKITVKIEKINVKNQTVTFVIGNETNVLKIIQKKKKAPSKNLKKR